MRPWSWPSGDVRLSIIWLSRSKQIKTACSLRPALATHDMRAIRKECSWFHMWSMHASSWIKIQDGTFIILVFEKRTLLYKQKKNIGVPGIDGGRLELPCSDHRWRGRSVLSTLDSGVLPDPEGGGAKIKLVQVMGWPMCAIIKIWVGLH